MISQIIFHADAVLNILNRFMIVIDWFVPSLSMFKLTIT